MKSLVIIFLAMFATSANDTDKCFKILSTDGQYFIIQIVTVDGLVPKTPFSTSLAPELRGDWEKGYFNVQKTVCHLMANMIPYQQPEHHARMLDELRTIAFPEQERSTEF